MDVTKVKRILGQCSDPVEINKVIKSAQARLKTVLAQMRKRKIAETTAWAKSLKEGDTFYCARPGVKLWKGYQYGDALTFVAWQPRKKLLWFDFERKRYWAYAGGIIDECLQGEKPKAKPAMLSHKMAAEMGDMLK